jgi:long-chain acyl-CoA synthetase
MSPSAAVLDSPSAHSTAKSPRLGAAQRPWLSQYPEGVPQQIQQDPSLSLVDLLEEAFRRHASHRAQVYMDHAQRFSDIDEQSAAFASWLQQLGLQRGARVALMMPNCPQYMVAIAGVLRAGMVVVNVNPLYTARELQHQLQDSGAEAIVILENVAHTLEEVIEHTPVRHVVLAALGDALPLWRQVLVNFAVRHVKKMVREFRQIGRASCRERVS